MTRGGRAGKADRSERRCIVTGESRPVSELVRFVVGPDDAIVPDVAGRLPGRGIWVSADRAALEKAVRTNAFSRAARRRVVVPEGLVEQLERQLVDRLVGLVSLARKGGGAVAGYEKTLALLRSGRAGALIQASDGSPAQKARLQPPGGEERRIECLTANELGLAFGRENVIHAALVSGGLAERVVQEAPRLATLRARRDQASRHQEDAPAPGRPHAGTGDR